MTELTIQRESYWDLSDSLEMLAPTDVKRNRWVRFDAMNRLVLIAAREAEEVVALAVFVQREALASGEGYFIAESHSGIIDAAFVTECESILQNIGMEKVVFTLPADSSHLASLSRLHYAPDEVTLRKHLAN